MKDNAGIRRMLRLMLRPEGLFLLLAFSLMPLVSGFMLYSNQKEALRSELADLCLSIRENIPEGAYLELAGHDRPLEPAYSQILGDLARIHRSNPRIMYIYTMRREGDQSRYLLDTMQDAATSKIVTARFPDASVSDFGEPYEYEAFTASERAALMLNGYLVDETIYTEGQDRLIGCQVMLRRDGNVMDLMGVDFDASQLESIEANIRGSGIAGAMIGMLFLLLSLRYLHQYLTTKQQLIDHLDKISNTDSLTEIPNRRAFFEGAEKLVSAAPFGTTVAAAIVDIDHFKALNDNFGHKCGDEVLKHFAKLLNHTCNPRKFVIGRIGGEEFGIVCATREEGDINAALGDFRNLLANSPIEFEGDSHTVTFSAGYVLTPAIQANVSAMLQKADKALYESKHTGRDRITAFEETDK